MALRLLFTFSGLMIDTVMFTIHFSDPKIVPGTTALTAGTAGNRRNQKEAAGLRTAQPLLPGSGVTTSDKKHILSQPFTGKPYL
jgi:hypothetical protein